MTDELDQLVTLTARLAGVSRPPWLNDDAPLLDQSRASDDPDFYLVGLIGGKDVGKSALVNALVGRVITPPTSHGPGTQSVIAYVHRSRAAALAVLLRAQAPGQFSIIEHDEPALGRQALLDLPDIDSHWSEHVALTRRMLRHMLFPVWVQSVEKYADRQPQELLAKVAAGNTPRNFIFCLNKVDQVDKPQGRRGGRALSPPEGGGPAAPDQNNSRSLALGGSPAPALRDAPGPAQGNPQAIAQLQEDFAARLAKLLKLDAPPRVWAISAAHPDRYDLPELRSLLSQQKSDADVALSRQRAALRRQASILGWMDEQGLEERLARLKRLEENAREQLDDRVGAPLLEGFLPRLGDDPGYRRAIFDRCLHARMKRWPIVNLLHGLFWGASALIRHNTDARARQSLALDGPALVDSHLADLSRSAPIVEPGKVSNKTGQSLPQMVKTAFALLQQSQPAISALYADRKLWEDIPASAAAAQLRDTLASAIDRQRDALGQRLAGRDSAGRAIVRWLLTIGAIPWFVLVQPLLEEYTALAPNAPHAMRGLLHRFIQLLSADFLLRNLSFLLIYFIVLWLVIRWDTNRRLRRELARWREEADGPASAAAPSLTGLTLDWLRGLLAPIQSARQSLDDLVNRANALRAKLPSDEP